MKYRVLQLTNTNIGAIAIDEFLPFGNITRKISSRNNCCQTFNVSTTGADTIILNEPGNYRISYSVSLTADAAGEIGVALIANGNEVYSVNTSAGGAGVIINLTLPYEVRVCPNSCAVPNNCPMTIQIKLTGVAITAGTSNILVEKVY